MKGFSFFIFSLMSSLMLGVRVASASNCLADPKRFLGMVKISLRASFIVCRASDVSKRECQIELRRDKLISQRLLSLFHLLELRISFHRVTSFGGTLTSLESHGASLALMNENSIRIYPVFRGGKIMYPGWGGRQLVAAAIR